MKTMAFSIDEIEPIDQRGQVFNLTLIPDMKTEYFAPLHLRSVNIKRELLEKPFYDAIMHKNSEFGEINDRPKPDQFFSSVIQGAYYLIERSKMPDDLYNPETIIGPDNDFFREGLQEDSPYKFLQYAREPLNVNKAIPEILNPDTGNGDALYVYGLYVGQGDSILIVCPNGGTYLIDTNYYWINNPGVFNEINRILTFHGLEENRIKAMIITHKHLDHIRGSWEFLKRFSVDYLLMNFDYDHPTKPVQLLLRTANERVHNLVNVNEPAIIQEGRVIISIKNPDSFTKNKTSAPDINDSSIAIDVEHMGRHVFLTGDAGYPIVCTRFGQNRISGNVLKVAHHGSRTGTNEELLHNLHPQYSFISAGNHKRFCHPHEEIREMIDRRSVLTVSKDIRQTVCYRVSSDRICRYYINSRICFRN